MTVPLSSAARSPLTTLDARTLGRPVHLLDRFAEQLRDDLADWLRIRYNLRYRARFELDGATMRCLDGPAPGSAWTAFGDGDDTLCCAIDRDLVLSVLAYRYGLRAAISANGEAPRATATEERLAAQLAEQFAAVVALRIEAGLGPRPADPPMLAAAQAGPTTPPARAWCIELGLREQAHGVAGTLRCVIGEARMARLWHALAPLRAKPAPAAEPAAPLAARLGFRVVARLLQKDMPLGDLAELRVGDVIPISLGATDVLVDDARLFTAAVAEHQGKLCLTSFADVD